MTIRFHKHDISSLAPYEGKNIAIDSETLGLNPLRDRLCVVQLSPGDGTADIIQIERGQAPPKNLITLLTSTTQTKIFHYARFDIAVLFHSFGVMTTPIYCTKIASKLVRTYTDRHGLKDLTKELLGIDISKAQQSSDWAAENLSQAQLDYAASDVLNLHALKDKLDKMLAREGRLELAQAAFTFLPTRAKMDLLGYGEMDIFGHS
jgi:ribonuclease D